MVKKGLIDTSMSAEEIEQFIQEGVDFPAEGVAAATEFQRLLDTNKTAEPVKCKETDKGNVPMATTLGSPCTSEVTIYKRAVQQIAPDLEEQINRFVTDTRKSLIPLMPPELPAKDIGRKVLSCSDELMDTSDETEDVNMFLFTGPDATKKIKTPGEKADDYIRDAEHSHARMMEVEGKELTQADNSFNVSLIDNDYQMIDAHLDKSIRKKIWNYEFIDFGKLLVRGCAGRDNEHRLEFVTKNGQTFLTPVGDCDSSHISSYAKWEQAFRIFSNVLTSKFPQKATELLQYNHTIHTASMSYHWKNVYTYNKEFRHHIARHPYHAWNIILQQVWTMLLKDHLWHDNGPFQKQNYNRKGGEPCCRYNKGKCTFGLSCKYDHRCSVKRCGNFGHGAFQCQMRNEVDHPVTRK